MSIRIIKKPCDVFRAECPHCHAILEYDVYDASRDECIRQALAIPFVNDALIRADTVRNMHSEIKKRCIEGGIYPAFVASAIDQIAKEMLE